MVAISCTDSVRTKWLTAIGGFSNIRSSNTFGGGYRKVVDEYFRDHSNYWRDVYQADTLSACIYRERQVAVLGMVDKLRLPEGSNALEVGCGAGLTAAALAKRGFVVTATDTVEDMLGLTRKAAVEARVEARVKTSLADVQQLSFPSHFFDLVMTVGVLPWLDCPENALAEMSRVTKHHGYVILTVDSNWCLNQILDPMCFPGLRPIRWKVAKALEDFNVRIPSKPRVRRHSIRRIDGLIRRVGLQKLEWRTLGFGPFSCFRQKLLPDSAGIKVHRALQALADRKCPGFRSLGTEYVVTAQKT